MLYVVLYRSGAEWNYRWRATESRFASKAAAEAKADELCRKGFGVLVKPADKAALPASYEV